MSRHERHRRRAVRRFREPSRALRSEGWRSLRAWEPLELLIFPPALLLPGMASPRLLDVDDERVSRLFGEAPARGEA